MQAQSDSSPPLGTGLSWARDFALIGAVTGFAAPAPFWWHELPYLAACSVTGAVVGALLGLALSGLLLGPLSRMPFGLLLGVGLLVGAAWGALSGFGGGFCEMHALTRLSTMCGAVAGALQLGWFFVPYVLRRARGKSAWIVVVAACAISAGLGFAALEALAVSGDELSLITHTLGL